MWKIGLAPVFADKHVFKVAALEKTIAYPVEPTLYEANALSRPASFWLVYSEEGTPDDTFLFDNVRDQLKGDLRSVLTGAVIDDVQILPAENLAKRLPSTPTVA